MNKRNKGIVLSYFYTFMNMVCGLFLSSFLLRMLGDTEYGIYQTISSFAMYLVLLEFGTGTVLTRNILVCRNSGKSERVKNVVSTMWVLTIVLAIVIIIVSSIFYINIDNIYANTMNTQQILYGKKIFVIITIYLVVSFFSQTLSGIALGMENYTFSQTIKITTLISRVILLVSIIWFNRQAVMIAYVDAILAVLAFVVGYVFLKCKYNISVKIGYFDFGVVKDSFPLCMALLLQAFTNQANNNVDKTIIGIMLSMESVSVYSVAQYIYSAFSSFTTIPISMYMPQISKDMAKGLKGRELTQTLIQPCRLVVIVGGMIIGGFFAVGEQFISLVYGYSKSEAWIYALIIMIPMFLNMTNGVINNILDITNKRLVRSFALFLTTVLNIILTIVLIQRIGIIGAVIATAISTVLGQIIILNIYYQKKLNLSIMYLFKEAYKGLLVFIIVAAILAYSIARMIPNDLIGLLCGGILFVIVSGIGIIAFGLNSCEKQFIKKIIKK